jgi:thioredoxin 1
LLAAHRAYDSIRSQQEALTMAGGATLEFTDANFDAEVLRSNVPVLVDFWAEWCAPCRMLGPTIDQLAAEYQGRVKVGKVDTDSNRDSAIKYGILNIPTVLLFRNGKIERKFVGLANKAEFQNALNAILT